MTTDKLLRPNLLTLPQWRAFTLLTLLLLCWGLRAEAGTGATPAAQLISTASIPNNGTILTEECTPVTAEHLPLKSTADSLKNYALFTGAMVALLTFFLSQVAIPLYKYRHEQRRGKRLMLVIMKAITDKTLDFFGGATQANLVAAQIDQQILQAQQDPHFIAHITVSKDDSFHSKILDETQFWLMDETVVNAFVRFEENSSRARFMCEAVMEKSYLDIVKHDRERYVAALKQISDHFQQWYQSTLDLKEILLKSSR